MKGFTKLTIPFTGKLTVQVPDQERVEGNREPYTQKGLAEDAVRRFSAAANYSTVNPERSDPGATDVHFFWNMGVLDRKPVDAKTVSKMSNSELAAWLLPNARQCVWQICPHEMPEGMHNPFALEMYQDDRGTLHIIQLFIERDHAKSETWFNHIQGYALYTNTGL